MLLRAIYSIPSDRRLMEPVEFNILYGWFLDLEQDAPAWTPEVFSMNRDRFLEHGLVRKVFDRVVAAGIDRKLSSNDHFTVAGTLVRSLASQKSVERMDGKESGKDDDASGGTAAANESGTPSRDEHVDWRGERRTKETHRSTTDPEAHFARKGSGKGVMRPESWKRLSLIFAQIAAGGGDGKGVPLSGGSARALASSRRPVRA